MMDRLVNAQGDIIRVASGYPYEMLTSAEVANSQRLRDQQMDELRKNNRELIDKLRRTTRRLEQILELTQEAGWDVDVMLATKKAFAEPVDTHGAMPRCNSCQRIWANGDRCPTCPVA